MVWKCVCVLLVFNYDTQGFVGGGGGYVFISAEVPNEPVFTVTSLRSLFD